MVEMSLAREQYWKPEKRSMIFAFQVNQGINYMTFSHSPNFFNNGETIIWKDLLDLLILKSVEGVGFHISFLIVSENEKEGQFQA